MSVERSAQAMVDADIKRIMSPGRCCLLMADNVCLKHTFIERYFISLHDINVTVSTAHIQSLMCIGL